MAIYKHRSGYRVQVDLGRTLEGKRDRATRLCSTKKEAERVERGLLLEKASLRGESNRITFQQFVADVWAPIKKAAVRANTYRGYDRDIRLRLLPAFGNMNISDIKRAHIQRMLTACPSYSTAKNARDTLRNILSEAVALDIIPRNTAAGSFKLPERDISPEQHNGAWLTDFSEHAEFLKAIEGDEAETIAVLGLCFGLRKGEIFGLDWEDVNLVAREINIRRTYTFSAGSGTLLTPPKTERSRRTIPMTDYAYEYLKSLRTRDGITRLSGAVVSDKSGKRMHPHTGYKKFRKFVESSDVPELTILSLRHSFATACVRAGINVASLSKILGHTSVSTTLNRYVRPMLEDLHQDTELINKAFSAGYPSDSMAHNGTQTDIPAGNDG